MSWLLEAHEKSPKGDAEMQWLNGDSRLVIVAGRFVFILLPSDRYLKPF